MSHESQVLAGILLLSLVTVETGGLYLMKLWRDAGDATAFQIGFARAGHAHAAVLLMLGLIIQPYVDASELDGALAWAARSGVPIAAILIPAGFFFSSMGRGRTAPNRLVALIFAGAAILAVGLTTLGLGLLL
jgi:hypothetical protein